MESKLNPPKVKRQGGARFNSGRKPKYTEPCIKVNFKVPQSKVEEIKQAIADICEPLLVIQNKANGNDKKL